MSRVIYRSVSENRRRRSKGTIVLIVFLLLASAVAGGLLGYLTKGRQSITQLVTPPFGGKRIVRILMLGEDNTGLKGKARGLSDTIIMLNVNLDTNEVSGLSIPRDTKIDLEGYGGECKINAAHKMGGPALTEAAVEHLIGVRPDYFLKTNLDGFKQAVDLLGGVEIDVEKNMRYTDHWGGLYINLKKGRQILDGEHAMQYVRFRHDATGDIARMERQQKVLKVLAQKAVSPVNLPKLPSVFQAMMRNIETDLSIKDMVCLASLAKRVDMSQVKTATLPAVPERIGGASYMIMDPEKTTQVVQDIFFNQTLPGLPEVEVLNGSGVAGAAQKVADVLKQQGYKVIFVGNADRFDYTSSQVISHKDNVRNLDSIVNVLNSGSVKHDAASSPRADVTVIVGRDCIYLGAQG